MSRWATGLTHLDSAVLGAMFDAGMFPSRPYARTLSAIERIAASKACGEAVAWLQLQALAAEWLSPMPLVSSHGNFGNLYDPAAEPRFTECRLSNIGQLAVQSERGEIAALPIGLINGEVRPTLGLYFDLWPKEADGPTLRLTPGFQPAGMIAALRHLLHDPSATDDELLGMVEPWLGPFEPAPDPLDRLLETGIQTVTLTPVKPTDEGELAYRAASVELRLRNPLPALLRSWLASVPDDPAVTATTLDRMTALLLPDTIASLPPWTTS